MVSGVRKARILPRQCLNQLLDIWHAHASDHVVAGTGVEGSVAAGDNVAETGGANQRVDQRIEKRQRRLVRVRSRFVDQSAKACPNRRAPTGPAELLDLPIQKDEGTFSGIGRETYVRNQSIGAGRHAGALLPHGTLKERALSAALSGHAFSSATLPFGARTKLVPPTPMTHESDDAYSAWRGPSPPCPVLSGFDPASPLDTNTFTPAAASRRNFWCWVRTSPPGIKVSPKPKLMDSCRIPG
jgi:hypothetical protein